MKRLSFFAFVTCVAAHAQLKPNALVSLEQARSSIQTAEIEWLIHFEDDQSPFSNLYHASRYAANGDWIFKHLGDDKGNTAWDENGNPSSRWPDVFMQNQEGFMHYRDTSIGSKLWKSQPPKYKRRIKDIRALGMYHSGAELLYGTKSIWTPWDPYALVFEEKQLPDGTFEVIGTSKQANKDGVPILSTHWYIDPDKGWNTTRVIQKDLTGTIRSETVSTLAKYGDTWFPERVDYYIEGKLRNSIQVTSAAFNQDEHSKKFTPADLGFKNGYMTTVMGERAPTGMRRWAGDRMIDEIEFFRLEQQGKIKRDARFLLADPEAASPYMSEQRKRERKARWQAEVLRYNLRKHEGSWSKFVRAFIKRYQLNEEQQQKAWQIHKQCKRRADTYIRRIAREYQRLTTLEEKGENVSEKKAKLTQPIEDVFNKHLVPRLNKLPTRRQRDAAKEADKQAERDKTSREKP